MDGSRLAESPPRPTIRVSCTFLDSAFCVSFALLELLGAAAGSLLLQPVKASTEISVAASRWCVHFFIGNLLPSFFENVIYVSTTGSVAGPGVKMAWSIMAERCTDGRR